MNSPARPGGQLPLEFHRNQAATFDTFLPGPNVELVTALRALSAVPVPGRAIAIWGAGGTGRTHLLQALCAASMRERGEAVVYVPMRDALGFGPGVLEGAATRPLVCIDDIGLAAGHPDWEQALFGLYNAVRDRGQSFVFTADRAPRDLPFDLADLRTRLGWGLVYQLRPLADDDKLALIRQRGRERGLDIGQEVAEFLLRRLPRDVGGLCAIIERIDSASLAAHRHVTIPFVKTLLDAG